MSYLQINLWGDNLFDAWKGVNDALFFHNGSYQFTRPGVSVHAFHNQIHAKSATVPGLDLHAFGYTKTKWSMLLRLYFDSREFALLANRLIYYRSERRGRIYVPDLGYNFKTRENRLGACLMGLTIRYTDAVGWECEVFSRASEVTARWGVDVVFLYVFLKTLSKTLKKERPDLKWFKPKDVTVHWNAASMFQSMATAPLYLALTGQTDYLVYTPQDELTPWQQRVHKHFHDAFHTKKPKYQKYKTQARATKAYHQILGWSKLDKPVFTSQLVLPVEDIKIDSDFFTRKGFR
jgi:hypothetical protein